MRCVRMADLLPEEREQFLPADGADSGVASRIVCAFPAGSIHMTPSLWERVLARHRELGRMLTDAELGEVVQAESGVDHDA